MKKWTICAIIAVILAILMKWVFPSGSIAFNITAYPLVVSLFGFCYFLFGNPNNKPE